MNNELKLHIKKLQGRAILSLIAILLTIIFIGFSILFLLVPSFIAVVCFLIALINIVYLVYSNRIAKKELKEANYRPVIFHADSNFSYEEIAAIFGKITDKENVLSTAEDVLFFRLNRIFRLRIILYRTSNFHKKEFDSAKDRINKKANKELNISQWADRSEARKMMRFNIIYTDALNEDLYSFISQNANHNLTRVEGIINIVVVGNQIIIPPIYGECTLVEISRYKGTIKFIDQVLLKKQQKLAE